MGGLQALAEPKHIKSARQKGVRLLSNGAREGLACGGAPLVSRTIHKNRGRGPKGRPPGAGYDDRVGLENDSCIGPHSLGPRVDRQPHSLSRASAAYV